jgi:ParB-like chromosome segregation protein Spo0J
LKIRDRIVEFIRVPARELRPNPANWRVHPERQRAALQGVLAEIGFVDAVLARRLADGSLQLIDGHLRAETAPDADLPVLVVDLDDSEAATVLATFDPLSALAETDDAQLRALLDGVDTANAAVAELLDDLLKQTDNPDVRDKSDSSTETHSKDSTEERWVIIVDCRSETEQRETLELLQSHGLTCRALVS